METMRHLAVLAALALVPAGLVGCGGKSGAIPYVPGATGDDTGDTAGDTSDATGDATGSAATDDTGPADTGEQTGGTDATSDPIGADSCGNGICDSALGENSFECPDDCPVDAGPGTCANLCGAYNVLWTCQCESDCEVFGDCCPDYELYCPVGQCGDGACGVAENVASCPKDCAGPYSDVYEPCLAQQCTTEWAACGDYPGCKGTWECLTTCGPDLGCVELCEDGADEMAAQRLDAALECGKTAGCFSESGAIDVICGDGKCDTGEFASTCPSDCKKPGAASCNGRCGEFTQNAPCQCDGACSKFGECCADFEVLCL